MLKYLLGIQSRGYHTADDATVFLSCVTPAVKSSANSRQNHQPKCAKT